MMDSPKRPKLVGNFIRQKREALNLSQRALGLLFDPPVTTQFISNVERGVTPLPPAHVPTLTRALQVSEAEMMGLLEKEYTLKLSGRLGLPQENSLHEGAIIIPMNQGHISAIVSQTMTQASASDHEFMKRVCNAFQTSDAKTRQAFASLCDSLFNLGGGAAASVSVAVQQANVANATTAVLAGDRPQS